MALNDNQNDAVLSLKRLRDGNPKNLKAWYAADSVGAHGSTLSSLIKTGHVERLVRGGSVGPIEQLAYRLTTRGRGRAIMITAARNSRPDDTEDTP